MRPRVHEFRLAERTAGWLLAGAALGVALLALGAVVEPERLAWSYLVALLYWLTLSLGALCFVVVHHLTASTWFLVLRRLAEAAAGALPVLALLFVPLLFALDTLYPWMSPDEIADPHLREEVRKKAAYLDPTFFCVRTVLYFAIWIAAAEILWRGSVRQDAADDGGALVRRLKIASAVAAPAVGLAITFAGFDWVMSLAPSWVSSIFGAYFFGGCAVAGLALLAVASFALQRAGRLQGVVRTSHTHGLGKLLLTFVLLWTYLGFSQYFLMWIADVPSEAAWWVDRTHDEWRPVFLLLVLGHFALPFLVLLSRGLKRRAGGLAAVGGWLLALHGVDLYWQVMPELGSASLPLHWLDLAAWLGVGLPAVAFAAWRLTGHAEAVRGDPRFERSLEFQTR